MSKVHPTLVVESRGLQLAWLGRLAQRNEVRGLIRIRSISLLTGQRVGSAELCIFLRPVGRATCLILGGPNWSKTGRPGGLDKPNY